MAKPSGYEQGRIDASQELYERIFLLSPTKFESLYDIFISWYSEIHPEYTANTKTTELSTEQILFAKEFIKNHKGKRARFMGQNNRFLEGEIFGEKDGKIQFGSDNGVLVNVNEIVDIYG